MRPLLAVAIAANEHDSSIAVADDHCILAIVEAERVLRVKRMWCDRTSLELLLNYTLSALGKTVDDVTHWCGTAMGSPLLPTVERSTRETVTRFVTILGRRVPITLVNHHLAHAASGFFASPFDEAYIDACDAGGDGRKRAVFYGKRGRDGASLDEMSLESVEEFTGSYYDVCSYFLIKKYLHEGHFMGLAAFGEVDADACEWLRRHAAMLSGRPHEDSLTSLAHRFALGPFNPKDPRGQNFARSVQAVFEELRLQQIRAFAPDSANLVLTGGAALNIHANSQISAARSGPVFAPPWCDDTGQAVGALLYFTNMCLGFGPLVDPPFLGLGSGLEVDMTEALAERVVDDLLRGRVVAWHAERAEVGPRALGHRSLIASPADRETATFVSETVKQRAWFRPVAPMVLASEQSKWFDLADSSPFMLLSAAAKDLTLERAPGVVHVDGTARIQSTPPGHVLEPVLRGFYEASGIPMLINTSLNSRDQPIAQHYEQTLQLTRQSDRVVAYLDGRRFDR